MAEKKTDFCLLINQVSKRFKIYFRSFINFKEVLQIRYLNHNKTKIDQFSRFSDLLFTISLLSEEVGD